MDFKTATALNLTPELVWLSQQSHAKEFSSSSSDHGPSRPFSLQDWPCHCALCGEYFPEIGSDGTQSPGRDDTDEEADSTWDDFSHALFAQEQVILGDNDDLVSDDAHQMSASIVGIMSPVKPVPSLSCSSLTPSPPSPVMEISYSPSPSSAPYPELMVASSPIQMETLLAPLAVSRPRGSNSRRRLPVPVAAWQRVMLREAFTGDVRQPGRERLRELAQRTHLTVSEVSHWFAEQRRILSNRKKFGFFFAGSTSPPTAARTLKVSTVGHSRSH